MSVKHLLEIIIILGFVYVCLFACLIMFRAKAEFSVKEKKEKILDIASVIFLMVTSLFSMVYYGPIRFDLGNQISDRLGRFLSMLTGGNTYVMTALVCIFIMVPGIILISMGMRHVVDNNELDLSPLYWYILIFAVSRFTFANLWTTSGANLIFLLIAIAVYLGAHIIYPGDKARDAIAYGMSNSATASNTKKTLCEKLENRIGPKWMGILEKALLIVMIIAAAVFIYMDRVNEEDYAIRNYWVRTLVALLECAIFSNLAAYMEGKDIVGEEDARGSERLVSQDIREDDEVKDDKDSLHIEKIGDSKPRKPWPINRQLTGKIAMVVLIGLINMFWLSFI